jgi:hypothetical protein
LERFDDDGAVQTDGWQTIASFGHNIDTNVDRLTVDNLTVGGSDLGQALAAMEPAFVVEAPLEKDYNFSTGVTTLRVDTTGMGLSPFWCAGKVGFNGTVLSTSGQVNFTVVRTGPGQYTVTYATPHPQEHNIVQVSGFGYATVSNTSATGFSVQLRNTALTIADHTFYITVLA